MILNKHDFKAISEILIARSAISSVQDSYDRFKPQGSKYKLLTIERVKEESQEKFDILRKMTDKFILGIGKQKLTTLINRAENHINTADEMVKSELKQKTDDIGNICEKKILSGLSITQAALINAERILSDSLERSSNKDMITKDIIQDALDVIETILDWIDEKYDYLARYMQKNEIDLTMKRANNYLTITNQEMGLI